MLPQALWEIPKSRVPSAMALSLLISFGRGTKRSREPPKPSLKWDHSLNRGTSVVWPTVDPSLCGCQAHPVRWLELWNLSQESKLSLCWYRFLSQNEIPVEIPVSLGSVVSIVWYRECLLECLNLCQVGYTSLSLEDQKSKVMLNYIANLGTTWVTWNPVLKIKQQNIMDSETRLP